MKRLLLFIALAAVSVLSVFSCQQELEVIRVGSVSLSKSALELTVGEQASLDVTISPDNATNKDVIWTSDNEAVATVSAEGVVKALRAGSANVIVTTVDQGKTASCAITVAEKMGAVTGEATHISCRNAKLSGKVTLSQTSSTNLSFGVLYSTSSGIQLGSATQLEAKDFDANYNYTIDTGVLEPETTYYYRSYIIQNDEVEYGETKSFKTLALNSMIQTLDASDVVLKEATLNAMLDLTDCNYSSIEYGFELTPEGGQAKLLKANNQADKAFSYRDETLVNNTGYSYAAYVILDDVPYKGETKTFTTASIQASVTAEASEIQCKSAAISGCLSVQSEGSFSKSAVLYYSSSESTLEDLKSKGARKTLTLGADGSYSETLSSLSSSTSYNFVVVAQVDDAEFVTEIKSFKTLTIQASVTAEASEIQCKSAAISGCLSVQSEGSFSKSAVLYYSSSESTLEGLKSKGTRKTLTLDADGSYSETLSSLYSSTSYNFVVVAKVDDAEFVTEIKSFKTLTIQASVTAEASSIQYHAATISGRLSVQSEGSFSKSAVLYYSSSESTLEGLKSKGTRKTLTLGADGSYIKTLSSLLSSSTSYNFIVVAKMDNVEFVTEIKSFKTLTIQASVTAEASSIQYHAATISGRLTVQSEGSFSKSAVLYYSSSESTLEGLKSEGTRKTLTLGADGSYGEVIYSLLSSTSYNFIVVAQVDDVEFLSATGNFTTPASPSGFVDLGLSVLWASCNLGASKPTEYGGYYQWAGTKDPTHTNIYLDWSNCCYHTGSDGDTGWTKYNTIESYGTVDNKIVLESMDDAASVALGGKCRMPTCKEWEELIVNCFWTWTSIDGVKGYKVQSKKFGYTDNWIFLPAAGSRNRDYFSPVGSSGYYWSSSLNTDRPSHACNVYFFSGDVCRDNIGRYCGQSVRPVSE